MICPQCREAGATENYSLAQKLHDKCPAVTKELPNLCDCMHLILAEKKQEAFNRTDC